MEPLHYDINTKIPQKKVDIQCKKGITRPIVKTSSEARLIQVKVIKQPVGEAVGMTRGKVGIVDGLERVVVAPVVSTVGVSVTANIVTPEAEVVAGKTTIALEDLAEAASNDVIETDALASDAPEVTLEVTQAAVPLLEDNHLGFDVTDLLNDNSLGELAENDETLLSDFDLLTVANKLAVLHDDLFEATTVKVVGAPEGIEVVEGVVATPSVEGEFGRPGSDVIAFSNSGLGLDAERSSHSGEGEQRSNDRGFAEEHCDIQVEGGKFQVWLAR